MSGLVANARTAFGQAEVSQSDSSGVPAGVG